MAKLLNILFLMAALLFAAELHAAQIQKVRFGIEPTYPPFEFIDASGKTQGFDIEIARAICKNLNATCEFNNQTFASLIPSLKLGKFDAIISALDTTEERIKQIDFTKPYYQPSGNYVGLKGASLKTLTNSSVGVQQGSTFEHYLKDTYGRQLTIKTYSSIQDAFLDLTSGRINFVLADSPIAHTWLKDNSEKFSIVDAPITGEKYFGNGYAIAVKKNNEELLAAMNKALQDIKTSGEYQRIYNKYFGS